MSNINESRIRSVLTNVFNEYQFKIEDQALTKLAQSANAQIIRAASGLQECGIEEGDFLTPLWEGTVDAFVNYKRKDITVSCISKCIKNRIIDVCRAANSKGNLPLNNGMQTMAAAKSKQSALNQMSDTGEMDIFDHQSRDIANLCFIESEYYNSTFEFIRESIREMQNDETYQKVMIAWFGGHSNNEIAKKFEMPYRTVAQVVKNFFEKTKAKILAYLKGEDENNSDEFPSSN